MPNGAYRYDIDDATQATLERGVSVRDTFRYMISDGQGGTSDTTLTITITGGNNGPTAVADTAIVDEGHNVGGYLLTNDRDWEGDQLTVVNVLGINPYHEFQSNVPVPGSYGGLSVMPNGVYRYEIDDATEATLGSGDSVMDTFQYMISDGQGGTSETTLTIMIRGASGSRSPSFHPSRMTPPEDEGATVEPAERQLVGLHAGDTQQAERGGSIAEDVTDEKRDKPVDGEYGELRMDAQGNFEYEPDLPVCGLIPSGQTRVDTFTASYEGDKGELEHLAFHARIHKHGDDLDVTYEVDRAGSGDEYVFAEDATPNLFDVMDVASGVDVEGVIVARFHGALGSDPSQQLDLRDVLVGESADAETLSNYLSFEHKDGDTIVHVDKQGLFGQGGDEDVQITLRDVDLTQGGSQEDRAIIEELLRSNQLLVDEG